jgi:hypothetical protein
MRTLGILLRKLLSIILTLLISLSSFLSFPQVALSQTQSSTAQITTAQNTAVTFPDIQTHWAQQYIEPLARLGIVVGYPEDGQFKPDNLVTRVEFAAIINRAFTPSAERPADNFVDVPAEFWGYSAIQTAYQGGFLEGYPDRKFQPSQNIPRVEVLVSLASGLKIQPNDIGVVSVYADSSQIPNYAVPAIAAATERRMVVNYPNLDRLEPNRTATRAEVAAFVYQALVYSGSPPGSSQGGGETPGGSGNSSTGTGLVIADPTTLPESSSGEPNGIHVTIPNFPNVDGQSVTNGQPVQITANARDERGNDLSSTIVWRDQEGRVVGQGATITFTPSETKIETLTATASGENSQTNYRKVTFSVSPDDIITPENVKVLPTEVVVDNNGNPGILEDVEGIPGKICFTNNRSAWGRTIPTLNVGDVMLGASGTIPPVKILKISTPQSNRSCVEVDFAPIEEFFPRRKDGQPFDIPSLLPEAERTIRYNTSNNPDEQDWVAIDPRLPSNLNRPYPGIGRHYPNPEAYPREDEEVGSGVTHPSSPTGKIPSRPAGNGLRNMPSKKWPSYLSECIRQEYSRRYRLAEQDAIDKGFTQSKDRRTTSMDYPFERLPNPNSIIPPEKYQFAFDIKELLEEDNNSREPIRTESARMNTDAGRRTSSTFKSTAKTEHEQRLDLLAYFGFKLKAQVPENGRRFEGIDFKDYNSVIGFTQGNFFQFAMDIKVDETLMAGVAMDGLYRLEKTKDIPIPSGFEGPGAPRVSFAVGLVPVWIDFPLSLNLKLQAGMELGYKEGTFGFLQNGFGDFTFNYGGRSAWINNIDKKSIVGSNFCGYSDIKGFAEARFQPHIQVLLYSLMGPELGIEPYARLDADHPQALLSVTSPQQSSQAVNVDQAQELQLRASVANTLSIPVKASTGVDFAMTPAVVSDYIIRRIPSTKVNIGRLCLPLPEPPREQSTNRRVVTAVLTGGASEAGTVAEAAGIPTCIGPKQIDFNPNKYLRRAFTFRANLVNKQRDVPFTDIPIVEPFSRILQGFFDNATFIWTSTKTGESIAASSPGRPVTLDKCSLPEGSQGINVEAFSPFDSQLKQPLGRAYVPISVQAKPEECF